MAEFIAKPYGSTLVELGGEFPALVVLDADLQRATETQAFAKVYPQRHFNIGVAEANMICIAAGLALSGKKVYCGTFACFITQRVYDQVAISVAYTNADVKLFGFEPALCSGGNGATHQSMMDLAIMRAMPNMTVYDPVDGIDFKAIMNYQAKNLGPAYIRAYRKRAPIILDVNTHQFSPGKAYCLQNGKDVAIIASGIMLARAIQAAHELEMDGISVHLLAMSSIKPIDEDAITFAAKRAGCIVTAENHSVIGGLGGAVAEVVTSVRPVPVIRVGIKDKFGEIGSQDWLEQKFETSAKHIYQAAKQAMRLK